MSKKTWKNVNDTLSLQFSTKSSWSQEEVDTPAEDVNVIRAILPTKTSATRQITDLESMNPDGPFLLNFSNIPYEATEADVKKFFANFDIINIVKGDQRRRNGIIEFRDLKNLTDALNLNDKLFSNRPIKLCIGSKDDLARLRSGAGHRYQNQQRSQQSAINEESDNWRVRKIQAPAQSPSDNYSANKEKTNWRDRNTPRGSEDKSAIDNSDSWRRPRNSDNRPSPKDARNFNRPPQESAPRTPNSDVEQAGKKASIFGDAKPVDTTAKDLEIEKKLESKKQVSDDIEAAPKANAWNTKKPANPSTTPDKSSTTLEWRTQKITPVARSKQNSESAQKTEPVLEPPKNPEPIPAPMPINVWKERMKSKSTVPTNPPVVVETRNNNAQKSIQEKTVDCVEPVASSVNANVAAVPAMQQHDKPVAQKPPVIISANGPFLDPKSRTPHHSMSDNSFKIPTAVPVSKNTDSKSLDHPVPISRPTTCSEIKSVPSKACGAQSSWSKGPPKGLIDKLDVNQ